MVAPGCLEHRARSLGICCSIHLSYGAPRRGGSDGDSISPPRLGWTLLVVLLTSLAVVITVVVVAAALADPADPPDHTGLRDLNERTVEAAAPWRSAGLGLVHEPRARIALAEVAHRAVIDEVERVVGSEHRRVRPVDAAQRRNLDERLVIRNLAAGRAVGVVELIRLLAVERESRLLEAESLTRAGEVDQLD